MAGYALLCLKSDFLEVCVHNAVIARLLLVVCASIGAGLCACGLLLGSSGSLIHLLEDVAQSILLALMSSMEPDWTAVFRSASFASASLLTSAGILSPFSFSIFSVWNTI